MEMPSPVHLLELLKLFKLALPSASKDAEQLEHSCTGDENTKWSNH